MMNQILAKTREVVNKLNSYGYSPINLQYSVEKLRPGVAGSARYSKSEVAISEDYLQFHPEHIFDVTIPHEICHHYVDKYFPRAKQAHGPEFRRLMNILGLKGDTYHSLGVVPGTSGKKQMRIEYKCECKTHQITTTKHNRIVAGKTKYHCLACKTTIVKS